MKSLERQGWDYKEGLCVGESYDFKVPADMEATVSGLSHDEFPVYVAAIKLGMRFLPHPFVVDVLGGFNIEVTQLTP